MRQIPGGFRVSEVDFAAAWGDDMLEFWFSREPAGAPTQSYAAENMRQLCLVVLAYYVHLLDREVLYGCSDLAGRHVLDPDWLRQGLTLSACGYEMVDSAVERVPLVTGPWMWLPQVIDRSEDLGQNLLLFA
jgi:hypothetical protein